MTTPAKLELTIKLNLMPANITTTPNGWKAFTLNCDGTEVLVTMRPKAFGQLEAAQRDWPSWVAAISGKMGPRTERSFELLEPNVKVFERKAKAPKAEQRSPEPAT